MDQALRKLDFQYFLIFRSHGSLVVGFVLVSGLLFKVPPTLTKKKQFEDSPFAKLISFLHYFTSSSKAHERAIQLS